MIKRGFFENNDIRRKRKLGIQRALWWKLLIDLYESLDPMPLSIDYNSFQNDILIILILYLKCVRRDVDFQTMDNFFNTVEVWDDMI